MIETRDDLRLQPVSIMLCGARQLVGCSSEFDPTDRRDPRDFPGTDWILFNTGTLSGGDGMGSMAFCSWACASAWTATAPAFANGRSAPREPRPVDAAAAAKANAST
jgi:hypothetical protein